VKKNYIYFLLIFVIIIISITLIFNFSKNQNDSNLTNIKVSEVTHSIFYTPFYVALENGYFEEVEINVELMLVSGSDNVAASVLSNDTQIGLAGPESAIFVYNGGEKDYLQVFAGLTKRDGQFILSRKNEEFNWENLKGKEILIGRSTGMPALSFLQALENKGIKQSDVKINTSIEFAELSGSFIGGKGDYVNLFEPLASKLESNSQGYVVESVGQISGEFPYTAFYARKSYINDNKELLTKFTKALKKGMDYTLNNEGENIAKVIQKQFIDTDLNTLANMIDRYKESDAWLSTPFVEEKFYNTIVTLLKKNKLISSPIYYKDMVNNLYE